MHKPQERITGVSDPVTETLSTHAPGSDPVRDRVRRLLPGCAATRSRPPCCAWQLLSLVELLTIPWFSIASLKTENPATTALMRQRLQKRKTTGNR